MVYNDAIGIASTSAWAWVPTFGSNASLRAWTVRVNDTFGPTTLVRVSNIVAKARARSSAVLFFADGVRAAGRGHTGGRLVVYGFSCKCKSCIIFSASGRTPLSILGSLHGISMHCEKGSPV